MQELPFGQYAVRLIRGLGSMRMSGPSKADCRWRGCLTHGEGAALAYVTKTKQTCPSFQGHFSAATPRMCLSGRLRSRAAMCIYQ